MRQIRIENFSMQAIAWNYTLKKNPHKPGVLARALDRNEQGRMIPPYHSGLSFISCAGALTEPPIFLAACPLENPRVMRYLSRHVA